MEDLLQPTLVDVLPQHHIDSAHVVAALRAHLPPAFDGAVQIRQFQGGQYVRWSEARRSGRLPSRPGRWRSGAPRSRAARSGLHSSGTGIMR